MIQIFSFFMVYFHLSHAKDTYSFFLFNQCTVAESWIHMCEKLEKYEEIDLQNFLGSQMTLKGRREKKPLLFVKVQPTKFTATRAFFYLFSEVFCPNPLRYSIRNHFFYQLAIILGSKDFYLPLEMNEAILKTLQINIFTFKSCNLSCLLLFYG